MPTSSIGCFLSYSFVRGSTTKGTAGIGRLRTRRSIPSFGKGDRQPFKSQDTGYGFSHIGMYVCEFPIRHNDRNSDLGDVIFRSRAIPMREVQIRSRRSRPGRDRESDEEEGDKANGTARFEMVEFKNSTRWGIHKRSIHKPQARSSGQSPKWG